MLKNHLIIALRVLKRQKIYSFINIFGLLTGVTASLLIILYVADELSYDRFHSNAENVYRVNFHGKLQGQDINTARSGMPVGNALQAEAAGVESVARIEKWITCPVRYEDKAFTEMKFLLADSNFFNFFNYELVAGNPADVLKGSGKIVISERAAIRYFGYKGPGDLSPLGKTLVIGSEGAIVASVTGIAKDTPHNTHLRFDFLMSLPTSGYPENIWLNSNVYTYIRLSEGTDPASIQKILDGYIQTHCASEIQQFLNLSFEDFRKQGGDIGFRMQPLTDIHLKSHFQDELEPNGNIEYVYLFSAVSAFILILACINFMNLSTARSASRAKEIGVRKAAGALRLKLIKQFITESFVYAFIAFAVAFAAVHIVLAPFNVLTGKELTTDMLYHPAFITAFILLLILVGLLAGSYPAFYLTSFKPVEVLKGRLRSGGRSSAFRNSLVVFQFVISIALIISSMMVYSQLSFLQSRDVGFSRENVVGIMHTMNLGPNAAAFKNELLRYPEFVAASYCSRVPPDVDWGALFSSVNANDNFSMAVVLADRDHMKALGLKLRKGRFFDEDHPADTVREVILNETAAKVMGIEDLENAKIRNAGDTSGRTFDVVGIVQDYNFETLKTAIRPLVIIPAEGANWGMAIRLSPGNPVQKIERLEQIWKKFAPQSPFEYSFIDHNFDAKFRSERRLGNVILVFTTLAILIACLGLFGLSTFNTEQRSKEVSIRKVMGASASQIMILLSVDFVKLILLSLLIAIPLTWFAMTEWLSTFAYRISFSTSTAVLAGLAALTIALLTVSFQSVRAALGNPVNWLRGD